MKSWHQRGAVLSLAPLALGVVAVLVRQTTYAPPHAHATHERATEFVPPSIFLSAARSPGAERTFTVDASASRAVLGADDESAPGSAALRVAGSLGVRADDALFAVELAIGPEDRPRCVLRAEHGVDHQSVVPGTHDCVLRARASVDGASEREIELAVTWMRLPGGSLRMHAAGALDESTRIGLDLALR